MSIIASKPNSPSVIDSLRSKLRSKGARTFRGLSKRFRQWAGEDGFIDRHEFVDELVHLGIDVPKEHVESLMKFFDKNGDGRISLDEFLIGI